MWNATRVKRMTCWYSGLWFTLIGDEKKIRRVRLDFFVGCLLKISPHGESPCAEWLNDRVFRTCSGFSLIITELTGRRHAYITNAIPYHHFSCSFRLRMAQLFFYTLTIVSQVELWVASPDDKKEISWVRLDFFAGCLLKIIPHGESPCGGTKWSSFWDS